MTDSNDEYEVARTAAFVKQNQRFPRRPKKPGDLVSKIISRYGVAAEQSTTQMDIAWSRSVSTNIADRTRLGSIKRKTLEIVVKSSAVLQQLSFQKKKILESMNQYCPDLDLKELKFKVGQID